MCPRSVSVQRLYTLNNAAHSQLKLSRAASFGDETFTGLDFTYDYDAVHFADMIEVVVAFLDVLSKESESLGLRVS